MDAFARIVLGRRHVLERRGMDDAVDVEHGHLQALTVADIADEIAQAAVLGLPQILLHLVLLHLVAGIDDQPPRLVTVEDGLDEPLAERAGAAGNQHRLALQVDRKVVVVRERQVVVPRCRSNGAGRRPTLAVGAEPDGTGVDRRQLRQVAPRNFVVIAWPWGDRLMMLGHDRSYRPNLLKFRISCGRDRRIRAAAVRRAVGTSFPPSACCLRRPRKAGPWKSRSSRCSVRHSGR